MPLRVHLAFGRIQSRAGRERVVDLSRVGGRGAPLDAVDNVALVARAIGEVGVVLHGGENFICHCNTETVHGDRRPQSEASHVNSLSLGPSVGPPFDGNCSQSPSFFSIPRSLSLFCPKTFTS
jgi:hypothetical protein